MSDYPYIEHVNASLIKVHLNCDVTIEVDPNNDELLTIVEHRLLHDDTQTDFHFVKDGHYWITQDKTEFRRDNLGTVTIKENGATLLNFPNPHTYLTRTGCYCDKDLKKLKTQKQRK